MEAAAAAEDARLFPPWWVDAIPTELQMRVRLSRHIRFRLPGAEPETEASVKCKLVGWISDRVSRPSKKARGEAPRLFVFGV